MSASISIKNAVKKYGPKAIIPGLSVEIKDKEFFTLLGPSGCGKTTLLRMIAGFNSIEGGDFYFNDKRINDIEASKRNIGMVFQNYAIFPHYTVKQNVEFGLKNRKLSGPEIEASTAEFLKLMQITEFKDRLPERLSGGQQQRVALARALVIKPDVLLMDEPLSNLDPKLRLEMRQPIRKLQKEVGITTVYVTHDQEEAMAISDRIAVMKDGIIQQLGSPQEIYHRPANTFVASFIGTTNLIPASLYPGAAPSAAILSVRPEDFQISSQPNGGLKSRVTDFIFLGKDTHILAELDGKQVQIIHESSMDGGFKAGDTVYLGIEPGKINAFSADGNRNLTHAAA